MDITKVTDSIKYIGVNDKEIDLFESQYIVPNGISYNSYVILDEKMAEAIEDAFRYDKIVLAAASYEGDVFPFMAEFLHHLKGKNYKKRKVALIENGSWAPSAGRVMRGVLETMKDISLCENIVTIKSTMKTENIAEMEAMAEELLAK